MKITGERILIELEDISDESQTSFGIIIKEESTKDTFSKGKILQVGPALCVGDDDEFKVGQTVTISIYAGLRFERGGKSLAIIRPDDIYFTGDDDRF